MSTSQEAQLRELYVDAKSAGNTELQEKIITRLESIKVPPQTEQIQQPQEVAPPDFIDRVQGKLEKRFDASMEAGRKFNKGDISRAEVGLRAVGDISGAALDVVGETVSTAFKEGTPESVKKFASEQWGSFMSTDAGKSGAEAMNKGIVAYSDWADENPRFARNIEALGNAGMLLSPVKKGNVRAGPTMLTKAAKKIKNKAITQESVRGLDKSIDIIRKETYKNTPEGSAEAIRTHVKGILREKKITPTEIERAVAKEASYSPGWSTSKSFTHNKDMVSAQIDKKAGALRKRMPEIFSPGMRESAKENLDTIIPKLLEENKLLKGSVKSATDLIEEAKMIIDKSPSSATGMWDARIALDKTIKEFKKQSTPEMGNIFDLVKKETRDVMNNSIIAHSPKSTNVAKSFDQLSNLYTARDVLLTKSKAEAANVVSRQMTNLNEIFGARSKMLSGAAILMGTTQLAASQVVAPVVGTVVGAYLTTKGIKQAIGTPGFKKGVAAMITATDKAINQVKNPSMLRQLRADRAILVDIVKSEKEFDEFSDE